MWICTSTLIRLHGVVLNYLSTGTTLPFIIIIIIIMTVESTAQRNVSTIA
jgi:phage shock protein PspC (stress-responsive transcriptional regulator)